MFTWIGNKFRATRAWLYAKIISFLTFIHVIKPTPPPVVSYHTSNVPIPSARVPQSASPTKPLENFWKVTQPKKMNGRVQAEGFTVYQG